MRRSGVWLLAWSAVGIVWAQSETMPDQAPQNAADGVAGPGLRWSLPPVVWSGSLAYDLRLDQTGGEPQRTAQYVTATLNGLTYLYQPWLALLSGTLGLTKGHGSGGHDGLSDDNQFVTGGLRLGVFPRSRFPLDIRYEVSDSRTDSSLGGGTAYRSRNFAITQQYRPPAGEFSLSASYERRSQDGSAFGEDTQESLLADFGTSWKRNTLNATVSRSLNRRQRSDESIDLRTVVARHSFVQGGELTLESSANWAQSDDQLAVGSSSTRISQWSSIALWRPHEQGLIVTASLRAFVFASPQLGTTDTLNAALGASYELTRNLRLNASGSMTRSDGTAAPVWVGQASASYQGDPLKLGAADYTWSLGAAASQSRTQGLQDNAVSGQLGHNLSRVWPLDAQSSLTGHLGQAISAAYNFGDAQVPGRSEAGLSRALTHNAGLTWFGQGASSHAYMRLSASDARQLDHERSRFQLVNAQLSGTYEVDRFRSWSGDLTVQRVFQRSLNLQPTVIDEFGFSRQITHTASGEITWRQMRLFGVPRLRFQSRLRLSQDARSQANVLLSQPEREEASWENRIDHQVGRLETSATLRASRTDGVWRGLVHLRMQRNF